MTSFLMLLNTGNLHLPWVQVLGITSKGHANAEMMEGEGFLQKYSLCTHWCRTGPTITKASIPQALVIATGFSKDLCKEPP